MPFPRRLSLLAHLVFAASLFAGAASATPAASANPTPSATATQSPARAPHIVNIVNFIRLLEPRDSAITQDVLFETVASQIRLMRENRLGGTFLLQYDALMNPRYQRLLKSLPDSNFEIGAWWEITQPHVERAGLQWRGRYPWDWDANVDFSTGYTPKEREKLVDVYMEDFKKIYGRYPASVGSWFIDSYTLDYMYRNYGIVATCNCKDQIGTDGYTLWGGYWNQAYYPSRKNAYMPAQTAAQQLPVPVFRMLGSDPIRQYESGLGSNGQGVITLEPVYPFGGGDANWVHWYFDEFAHGACMAYAYVQAGQENSFTWPAMQKGLDIQFPLIARLRDSGLVKVQTLEQSGRWFKKQFKLTPATAVTVNKDLDGGDQQTTWFDSRFFRLNILWDKHTLRIRDLHLFDENISDNIKKDSATGSYALLTLPFVDGFVWSDKTHLAGLRLKAKIDGREQELTGGDPVVTDATPGRLHIVWPLRTNAAFIIDVDERHLKMHMEGQAPAQWWLELTTAPNVLLPFTQIDPHTANARFHGTAYTVHATPGLFEQPLNGAPLTITPEKQAIVLDLAPRLFDAAQRPYSVELTTEHLSNPIGIDAEHPRFSWHVSDSEKPYHAISYTLLVGTDSAAIARGQAGQWQHQGHDDSAVHVYAGKPLKPFTRYFCQVRLTNGNGQIETSPVASFEMGMMEQGNWEGSWIGDTRDIRLKPAAYFRKGFNLDKKIISARVYIAAAGLYELSINGNRIGDHRLDPMYTRFDRRNLYVTYDVTGQLQQGANAVGVLLGNGWYNLQSTAVWYFDKAPWRARPSFCLDLRITYADGTIQTISTDNSWKTTHSGTVFNSIYTGEHIDGRLNIPHWDEPGFIDTAWNDAIYRPVPSPQVTAEAMVPIRIKDTLPATSMRRFSDTDYVFNIGRNIAGISGITVQGPAGTVIRLKHGEKLYPDGHVDQSNINVHYRPTDDTDPFQTDIYILGGNNNETFMPHFNYKGFQYVEVTGSQPLTLTKENLTGYFMHSDVPPAGTIETSNPVINKIWSATNASYLSNLYGYPTDCPQREKNGWTGDAQIAVETGLYNFDAITVYEKWLADLRDEQQPDGVLPNIVPTSGWGYDWANGPDWTSALAIIPWNVYLFYGDDKLLRDCYDNIRRYVDHITEKYPDGLTSWGLGDWIPVKSQTPVEFTSTCYYYADVDILARAAKLFHHEADYEKYTALATKIKRAFNDKYLDKTTGNYHQGLQTELSAALYWHLVPAEFIPRTAARLAARLKADSVKLDVGLLGTKTILNALSENGYNNLAYALASDTAYPSWGHWIVRGATTLLENWNIESQNDVSWNHIMFGEIGAWFYKGLGGIYPDTAAPGFRHIRLRPHIPRALKAFTATHASPYGPIVSGWNITDDGVIHYHVTIPSGATADLQLEIDGKLVKTANLKAGVTQFDIKRRP